MRAYDAGLQAHIAAVGARHQVALRPGEQIDHQADEVQEEDQQHPKDRAVHAARLGIASYPYQQGDADDQKNNGDKNEGAATTASRTSAGWIAGVVLRESGKRNE